MSTTTYKLVLVGPMVWGPAATEVAATVTWPQTFDDDDNSADVTGHFTILDADNDAPVNEMGRGERARQLLRMLEEGKLLEDDLQDSFASTDGLPIFADITSIPPVVEVDTIKPTELSATELSYLETNDTEALLRDLEAMLPEVTPPQSPPSAETMLIDIDELLFQRSYSLPDPETYLPPTPSSLSNYSTPVASPYASPAGCSSPYIGPSTPASQPSPYYAPSTPASQPSSPAASSSATWEDSDSNTDPDWTMDSAPGPSRGRAASTETRPKPYTRKGRQPEDRRERKKVQNKNAATRYRIKKKVEEDLLLGEEGELVTKNEELSGKVSDLANEIRIIKGLLRDQCKRLGIFKD